MEPIEVIDSAVKIGLGALITGIAGYLTAIKNNSASITKEVAAKKMSMISDAAELAEKYFYYNTRRINVMLGMIRYHGAGGIPMSQTEKERVKSTDEHLTEILESRNKAIAQIHLLKIQDAEAAMVAYNNVSTEFRQIVTYSGMIPTEQQLTDFSKRFLEEKKRFYSALSVALDNIG